jgi:hypothetical protein
MDMVEEVESVGETGREWGEAEGDDETEPEVEQPEVEEASELHGLAAAIALPCGGSGQSSLDFLARIRSTTNSSKTSMSPAASFAIRASAFESSWQLGCM